MTKPPLHCPLLVVAVNPPASGAKVDKYIIRLCPAPPGTPDALVQPVAASVSCANPIVVESFTIRALVTKLAPGARYWVSAQALIGGKLAPVANVLPLDMPSLGAPTLLTAVDTSSTKGAATAAPPPGVQFQKYIFTARPLNGGQPIVVEAATPQAAFAQLTPATQYEVTVVGVASGVKSPASSSLRFVTPTADTPANIGRSLTTQTGVVAVTPPATKGFTSYEVTACPVGGPDTLCVKTTCATPAKCDLNNLRQLTSYNVWTVGLTTANGQVVRNPRSNEDTFTTPPRPTLISAVAEGPTTALAVGTGAIGEKYKEFIFTVRPIKGGPNTVVRVPAPEARFFNLQPNTEVRQGAAGLAVALGRARMDATTQLVPAAPLRPCPTPPCSTRHRLRACWLTAASRWR